MDKIILELSGVNQDMQLACSLRYQRGRDLSGRFGARPSSKFNVKRQYVLSRAIPT